ncbi:TetR/AcrR family transcriptional regulator [Rhodococcus fascians]|nr:TetR/AcrR family transcriptional regulator [Rhodococcus fascians]MBY4140941.1 TetR/AcrR family transcriptional regulator [Rhodococcus fascians]MBY4219605.1 TetR/AcrR family transcriptional regulator [Rhodococcus fascians]MBY4221914.1 TetR/AcrR family transcriptional regulator [Rhodococcus fascians]MBY4233915.1 TetR/AcrR family transcriptional regulator [Rhodococcus fascians]
MLGPRNRRQRGLSAKVRPLTITRLGVTRLDSPPVWNCSGAAPYCTAHTVVLSSAGILLGVESARGSDVASPSGGPGVEGNRLREVREGAAKLFVERGYAATTMSRIASELGVLPGSLYHHFDSKEEIAVAILEHFAGDLDRLAVRLRDSQSDAEPVESLRGLVTGVMRVSLANGAAVRLRAFEPPTVASSRFVDARSLESPVLNRLWKRAVDNLAADDPTRTRDAGLLRFALTTLATDAGAHFSANRNPRTLAESLCTLTMNGLATDCPPDEDLDRAAAVVAAREMIASWPDPQSLDESDTRLRIVSAARREFARRGYHATTIRDVAEAAQVRMPTLYRRFESKEAILADTIETFTRSIASAIQVALTTGSSPVENLDALALVSLHARRRFRQETDILRFAPDGDSLDGPLTAYSAETDQRLKLVAKVVAAGQRDGTISDFASPRSLAPHVRYAHWVTYEDYSRTSLQRSHNFVRSVVLRGFLNA